MIWDAQHPLVLDQPEVQLIGTADCARLMIRDREVRRWDDPLAAFDATIDETWVGYLSYDLGRLFEDLPTNARDRFQTPLYIFGAAPTNSSRGEVLGRDEPIRSTFSRRQYLATVQRVIEYIARGDVYQVNLAQIFTSPQRECARAIFERLQTSAPAAYGALLSISEFDLISNSPELFFKVTAERQIITRPVKGTRRRAPGMERELLESAKDQAELAMIVDLERNDLGRICEAGSVRVVEPRVIEAHPTVYHGVATIEGQLRDDIGFLDILRAMFPCGSVTGAPKIRAMQIIDELEPVRRGPYCGAIGYVAANGTMEFNVAIRTMIAKDGLVHVPVGGGIVADSKPTEEYEETLVKARAMFDALGISLPG